MGDPVILNWADILSLVLYFILVLGVGFGVSCRSNTATSQGYFLAGRSSNWLLIGASTFSTNIGAPMFVGLAGSAAASGIAVTMFEWHAMLMLVALGWLFLPVYRACGCSTMPQYLKLRYGGNRISLLLAVVHTLNTLIALISGQMYAGALFIQQIFQWNIYISIGLILVCTAAYTVIGGLTAVLWTDAIQTVILIVGSFILAAICLVEVGGFEALRRQYMTAAANYTLLDQALYGNRSCGMPVNNAFHIFRSASDGSYPWPGLTVGLTILATNYWCTDQICVQRALSAKSVSHAKGGTLLAAYLKVLPFLFFVIPGMASRVLFPNDVACADPDDCRRICGNPSGCYNVAYPLLVARVLPSGLKGLMLAALLSALMSSLTSYFNSSSTIFTLDIYRRIRSRARERELMIVGRVYVLFLVGVSIAWIPVLEAVQGSNFWDYTQSIYSHILPPIVMAFLMGLFWKRTTEQAAFWSIIVSVIIGLSRLILTWIKTGPVCGSGDPDTRWRLISGVHYLHFAMILGAIAVVIQIAVSWMTPPRSPGKLRRVTFWTRSDPELQELSDSEFEDQDLDNDFEETGNVDLVVQEQQPQPKGKKNAAAFIKRYLCGIGEKGKRRRTRAEYLAEQKKMTDIYEEPFNKKLLDINAIICIGACIFLHAFWF